MITMTSEQADKLTTAMDQENIDMMAIEEVVKDQILTQGDCSPILQEVKTAVASGHPMLKRKAMHNLRTVWRPCQMRYVEASKEWLKAKVIEGWSKPLLIKDETDETA